MTLNEYKIHFKKALLPIYDELECNTMFAITMEEVLGYQKIDVMLKADEVLSENHVKRLEEVMELLRTEQPIQYIFNKGYFYGYEFKVSSATLIPRRETEELVEWVLQIMNEQPNKIWRVLDIGTGTGCIPITIKKEFPLADISAIDVSKEALQIAKENAVNLEADVLFIEKDILKTNELANYDIIISNPPYVRNLEKAEIKKNVLEFEPHLALFVEDDDPLIFYRKIAQLAHQFLNVNGFLFFEINQYLGKEMEEMMKEYFSDIELKKDILQNDRMMKMTKIIK